MNIYIIGGGAAGFFAAIRHKSLYPTHEVTILERQTKVLAKVEISGGGRCNVTHNCLEIKDLVKNYPRGQKELMSVFQRFDVQDTIDWFQSRGVKLKTEADNRMFPVSDSSKTIIDCLWKEAMKLKVHILTGSALKKITYLPETETFMLTSHKHTFPADKLIIATGSSGQMWEMLRELGHNIVEPVPSLFTFQIKDERLTDLEGISFDEVVANVEGTKLEEKGALLITHWGLSAPAILRLSAWGARILHEKGYHFSLKINFLPKYNPESLKAFFLSFKEKSPKKQVSSNTLLDLPTRFWKKMVAASGISDTLVWADTSKKQLQALTENLTAAMFEVTGKSAFKEEFVTCGGVERKEIDFKTMQSKKYKNVYFCGEVIDIDAITGGFNFQAAWTTGWIAGEGKE